MPSCRSTEFGARLLAWWDRHGRHDLPWQQPRTPYRIWIAEIMLQQTQVATVLGYYERFLQRFPDLESLARANRDAVLAAWSGLGYYRRALNLHRAAQICVRDHAGELPDTAEELLQLPGIGRSTANAIISQGQDRVLPILDGNLKRVLARHAGVAGWPGQNAVSARLWRAAEMRLPDQRGADYTQASMDLGALICQRRQPDCPACPVAGDCYARQHGRQHELPARKPSGTKPTRTLELLVCRRNGRVLLEQRPPAGIWASLWSLPELDEDTPRETLRPLPDVRHELTHVRLQIIPLQTDGWPADRVRERGLQWFDRRQALALGLPQPVRRLIEQMLED